MDFGSSLFPHFRENARVCLASSSLHHSLEIASWQKACMMSGFTLFSFLSEITVLPCLMSSVWKFCSCFLLVLFSSYSQHRGNSVPCYSLRTRVEVKDRCLRMYSSYINKEGLGQWKIWKCYGCDFVFRATVNFIFLSSSGHAVNVY